MNNPPQGIASSTAILVVTVTFVVWWLTLVIWCLSQTKRRGNIRYALVVVLLVTAAAAAETPYDALINWQWFHSEEGPVLYTAFQRHMPLWGALTYGAWIGTMAAIGFWAKENNWPKRTLWKVFAALVVFDFVGESLMMHFELAVYYGHQSPRLLEVPMVWPFVFTGSFLLIGMVFHHLIPKFSGARSVALVPMGIGVVFASGCFLGWPSMIGLGMELASPWTDVLAAITVATVLYWFGVVTNMQSVAPSHQTAATAPEKERVSGA
ncbi:hypothetical protein ACFV23_12295 [Streptomyces sp. NPDC059627]